jgi:malate permease and related proteins
MTQLVIPKAIALILLIVTGFLLQKKFENPASIAALRLFILNVALPATIFLSTVDINTQLNLIVLPSFALAVNLCLMFAGVGIARLLTRPSQPQQTRALILLFPSLAPGLTVYPFVEQFLGRQGLAWVALADMGNKLFVLIGLYALALYWFQKSALVQPANQTQAKRPGRWQTIARFLFTEPVNGAIVLGLVCASVQINTATLPLALVDAVQKFALCSTPLILFYVGVSLNLKKLQFGTLLLALFARAGLGFLISAAALALLQPSSIEAIALFISLPQASCSLWPLLHATTINQQADSTTPFFDVDFATALLALSFPFSILVLLVVFSGGAFFYTPMHLVIVGAGFLGLFTGLFLIKHLLKSRSHPSLSTTFAKRVDS